MFYRSTALVLAVSTVLVARQDDLPAIALTTFQSADGSTVEAHKVPPSLASTELKTENVFVSTPTPFVDEGSEDPQMLVAKQDHSMLLEASSTAPTNMQSTSVVVNESSSLDTDLPPAIATHEVTNVIAQPTYQTQHVSSNPPTYYGNQYENVPVANHYIDQNAGHYIDQNAGHYVDQNVNHYIDQNANHYVDQSANHYVDQNVVYHSNHTAYEPAAAYGYAAGSPTHPAVNTDNYGLFQYRRMMINGQAPHPHELQGTWRGVNKGVATLAIDKRFIKDFKNVNGQIYGDNIDVHQGSGGWEPVQDPRTGSVKRQGKFLVQRPHGIGPFKHGVILNYSKGGNRKLDPANLISDQLVKLDDNHMLGRATAKFGPIRIPLAYFVLQRVPE